MKSQQLPVSHDEATQDLPNSRVPADSVGSDGYGEDMIPSQLFANVDAGTVQSAAVTQDVTGYAIGDMDFDPHFQEFANFLDGVGFPTEWSPYFNGPPDRDEEVMEDSESRDSPGAVGSSHSGPKLRPGTPFSS
jgi:hypothetical protein